MKKLISLCILAYFAMLTCISATQKAEQSPSEIVQIKQKENSYSAETILVKREPKTTELEGTWKSVENEDIPYIKFYGSYFQLIEIMSENEYYEVKGTFRIKKDGSITLLFAKICDVVDGVSKGLYDLSEYKWITNLPDKITCENYSVDGDVLRLGTATFTRCEDIDWRIK
ncbi:MAG: hypothetical protein IKZ86_02935 [Spirochaetaceae bacterium]|nr:hypothetical protein [Spirochaetaceae bacterium]